MTVCIHIATPDMSHATQPHLPSAAVGAQRHIAANSLWQRQPAGQQLPRYCASMHGI